MDGEPMDDTPVQMPWGMTKEQLQPGAARKLSQPGGKAKSFSIGSQGKKSKLQLHRDKEAQKRKEAEDAAAAVYADFVDSFESDMTPGTKEFVKAGVAQDGKYSAGTKERYRPSNVPQVPKKKQPNVLDQAAQIQPKLPIKRKKEKSQREIFLEEMKQEQAARESRAAARKSGNRAGMSEPTQSLDGRNTMFDIAPAADSYAGVKGSFADADDDLTTNLYVGNLSPGTNEDYLARTFGIHGAIASVKIMWPRTDEERARGRNSGFVQYMERKSAERAKNALDGTMQNDMKMVVAWGKPVARPMVAMYPATVQTAAGFSAVGGWSVTQLGAMVRTPAGLGPAGSQQPALHAPRIPTHAPSITIVVKPPETMDIMLAADKLAEYVREDGWAFEQLILEKEADNPLFNFVHHTMSPDHTYYRWRCYSLANGDSIQKFRTAPFQMYAGGPMWQPPTCPVRAAEAEEAGRSFSEGTAKGAGEKAGGESEPGKPSEEDERPEKKRSREEEDREARMRERERDSDGRGRVYDGQLSVRQLDELHETLRKLTVDRKSVAAGMLFCLDHSEAADEIVATLVEAMTLPAAQSSAEKKLARFYVISDVLHNSSAPFPKTARYRTGLEAKMTDVLTSLREGMLAMPGRMMQEGFQEKVLRVLEAWSTWSLYPPQSLLAFRTAFTGQSAADNLDGEELDFDDFGDGAPPAKAQRTADEDEDVDGEAFDPDNSALSALSGYVDAD